MLDDAAGYACTSCPETLLHYRVHAANTACQHAQVQSARLATVRARAIAERAGRPVPARLCMALLGERQALSKIERVRLGDLFGRLLRMACADASNADNGCAEIRADAERRLQLVCDVNAQHWDKVALLVGLARWQPHMAARFLGKAARRYASSRQVQCAA